MKTIVFLIMTLFCVSWAAAIARAPYVDLEATVIDLHLSDLYVGCEDPHVCPQDTARVRIDAIDRTGDQAGSIRINPGEELEISFKYSARSARLVYDLVPDCPDGKVFRYEASGCVSPNCKGGNCMVSWTTNVQDKIYAEMIGETIVYHLPYRFPQTQRKKLPPGVEFKSARTSEDASDDQYEDSDVSQSDFPGVQVGDRIRIKISQGWFLDTEVFQYQIIK